MNDADMIIENLMLVPHPEGGHYREIFRDSPKPDGRAHSTAIYFLLKGGENSRWHRVDAAEIWHFYRGAPLELVVAADDSKPVRYVLGNTIEAGQSPQVVVPAYAWQTARPLGDYTLAGCTVAPGFCFEGFVLAGENVSRRLDSALRSSAVP
jgi:predicted cupin superfamily sugar epimerase